MEAQIQAELMERVLIFVSFGVLFVVALASTIYYFSTQEKEQANNRTDETDYIEPLYPKKPFKDIVTNDVIIYEYEDNSGYATVVAVVRSVHPSGKMTELQDVKVISGTMGKHVNDQVAIDYDSVKFKNLRFIHNTNIFKDRQAILETLKGKVF